MQRKASHRFRSRRRAFLAPALIAVASALAPMTVSRSAAASPTFPAVVQAKFGAPSTPDCTYCHHDLNGGVGTVVTTFGKFLLAHGAQAADTASLDTALQADIDTKQDSNGNGIPDAVEIKEGKNPSLSAASQAQVTELSPVAYGCGANLSGSSPDAPLAGALVAFALVAVGSRRRNSRRG